MTYQTENLAKILILTICSSVVSMTLVGQICGFFPLLQSGTHPHPTTSMENQIFT